MKANVELKCEGNPKSKERIFFYAKNVYGPWHHLTSLAWMI